MDDATSLEAHMHRTWKRIAPTPEQEAAYHFVPKDFGCPICGAMVRSVRPKMCPACAGEAERKRKKAWRMKVQAESMAARQA